MRTRRTPWFEGVRTLRADCGSRRTSHPRRQALEADERKVRRGQLALHLEQRKKRRTSPAEGIVRPAEITHGEALRGLRDAAGKLHRRTRRNSRTYHTDRRAL